MDLTQLRYFCRVASLKSFSHASSELNIAQPALTRQIQLLEREIGVQLLSRHSRGAQPTTAGLALLQRGLEVLALVEQTRREVAALGTEASGGLGLGFTPGLGRTFVPDVIEKYSAKFPDVSLDLIDGFSEEIAALLLADRLALGILSYEEENPLLVTELLSTEALWLVSAAAPDRETPRKYEIGDLVGLPLILARKPNGLRLSVERAASQGGIGLDVIIEAEASELIKELVRKGIAHTICPRSAVAPELASGEFVGAPLGDLTINRLLAYRTDRPLSRAAQAMIDLIREEAWRL
jgi:LysR family nitrogen assimilation transcriptional regulator